MTKKKRQGPKKTKKQVIKSANRQKKSAADLLRKEIVEELAHLEYSIDELWKMAARFKKITAKDRGPIYEEIWESSKYMIECLKRYWDALPASERRPEKSKSIFEIDLGPPMALGMTGLIAGMFSKALDDAIKQDEFPDSIDVGSIDIEGRPVDPEPKLLGPRGESEP